MIIERSLSLPVLRVAIAALSLAACRGESAGTNPSANPEATPETNPDAGPETKATYVVTYDGNGNTGGSVPIDGTRYEPGQTVIVLGNTGNAVRYGRAFAGWNTERSGSGQTYAPGQTFLMGPASVTLYGRWTTPVPDTGQTAKYTATFGEDSDYAIHPPAYTDNGDGTISDDVNGLTWQKCPNGLSGPDCTVGPGQAYNWYQASGTYDATSNPSSTDACGSLPGGGWRLPTRFELLSIANFGASFPAIDAKYFPTGVGYHWASATQASDPTAGGVVDFRDGMMRFVPKDGINAFRCVRATRPDATTYSDHMDGTVTDDTTGLIWQKQDDGTRRKWEDAISYCENLSLGGFSDWRLPNVKELGSLVDDTRPAPSINAAFTGMQSDPYWSSTANPASVLEAFFVCFDTCYAHYFQSGGYTPFYQKTNTYYARCVRAQ